MEALGLKTASQPHPQNDEIEIILRRLKQLLWSKISPTSNLPNIDLNQRLFYVTDWNISP